MGNTESVSDGNKAQVDTNACEWYKLLNLGGGEFVQIMRTAQKTRDFTEIDGAINEKIRPYLYNNGDGRYVPVSELTHVRRCYRENKPIKPPEGSTGYFTVKKKNRFSRHFLGQSTDSGFNIAANKQRVVPVDIEARKPKTVQPVKGKHKDFNNLSGEKMRFVCWDIYQRGTVGETIIHACLLRGLPVYLLLAKRLLHVFPKLIVDFYVSDQYYGETVLHMAIVNEDPAMVKYILENDEWMLPSTRSFGSFFCPFDQLDSRADVHDSEVISVKLKTNYKGNFYSGEFPLSFAAILCQEECVRLLVARGAHLDAQDSNGNTVLHMCVIHNLLHMFDLAYNLGATLAVRNARGLTPLTLAAELGRVDMYNHILLKERTIEWTYGGTTCAEYPLCDLDSVDEDGNINTRSALHLIIYGKEASHLEMVDGVVVKLLEEKWDIYIKKRYIIALLQFILYGCIFVGSYVLKPSRSYVTTTSSEFDAVNNLTSHLNTTTVFNCYLLYKQDGKSYDYKDISRFVAEGVILLFSCIYLVLAGNDAKHQGLRTYLTSLMSEPGSKGLFLITCVLNLFIVPCRFTCAYEIEEVMSLLIMMGTFPNFLFYCKGFHTIGPFVLMIYKMISGDIMRFLIIYFIFLIGFSQAMYLVFRGYNGTQSTQFDSPVEAILAMFYMSMGNFKQMYDSINHTNHVGIGKCIFLLYMLIVYIMLINMLIAMMGNTYQQINDTEKEYLRQWAQVILGIEYSVPPEQRARIRMMYSQQTKDGKRAMVVRWRQSEMEKQDLRERRDQMKFEQREQFIKKRKEHSMLTSQTNTQSNIEQGRLNGVSGSKTTNQKGSRISPIEEELFDL